MPFDDRGNDDIKLTDLSPLLLHDYLVKVKSSLADSSLTDHMEDVLEQPLFRKLWKDRVFQRYILLGTGEHAGMIQGIYDRNGNLC